MLLKMGLFLKVKKSRNRKIKGFRILF